MRAHLISQQVCTLHGSELAVGQNLTLTECMTENLHYTFYIVSLLFKNITIVQCNDAFGGVFHKNFYGTVLSQVSTGLHHRLVSTGSLFRLGKTFWHA